MIKRSNPNGDHKKHDTALRHKIRNLRAKVRLLLPMDVCCKEQKRSKNLIKMQYNRDHEMSSHQHRWNHTKQNISQLFIPQQPTQLKKHLFQKLSNAEIQQIKEDKIYYIGEEFVQQFDQFLEYKEKEKHKNMPQLKTLKVITQLQSISDLNLNHKPSLSFGEEIHYNEKSNYNAVRIKNLLKRQGTQAKRKLITEQDRTRRAYIKIKGRQKQQKSAINYQKFLAQKEHTIREKNTMNMFRTTQSLRRKKNDYQEIGQIYDLSEKLRNLCLLQHSKSTNLINRY